MDNEPLGEANRFHGVSPGFPLHLMFTHFFVVSQERLPPLVVHSNSNKTMRVDGNGGRGGSSVGVFMTALLWSGLLAPRRFSRVQPTNRAQCCDFP